MTLITKPMLASECKDVTKLDFENNTYLATPKIDGIRALKIGSNLVSRTFKQIRNTYIRTILEATLPDGADGEIICPGAFQKTTSGVMGESGEPEFIYYWFDYVKGDLDRSYINRVTDMLYEEANVCLKEHGAKIHTLVPATIRDLEHLKEYEQECIDKGFEGVCLRTSESPYKCGRATAKQQWLLKIKRFSDGEAKILKFGEKMHNDNPAEKDNFGRTVRSSHQENKHPAGTLGYLMVEDTKSKIQFNVGSGFNDELRQEIWDSRPDWKDLIIKYKYFSVGVKDKPRHPVYLGVRDKEDL